MPKLGQPNKMHDEYYNDVYNTNSDDDDDEYYYYYDDDDDDSDGHNFEPNKGLPDCVG